MTADPAGDRGGASRRPARIRAVRAVRMFAGWLARHAITPNQISAAGMAFAGFAAALLLLCPRLQAGWQPYLLAGAATCIALRTLCTLLDGMVAVEFGRGTASGRLFNELPDRVSDALILVAAGYSLAHAAALGWAAALLAVMTAYVRTLGVSCGLPGDFGGPMAKEHRMFVMIAACLLAIAGPMVGVRANILRWALALVAAGSALTVALRAHRAYRRLGDLDIVGGPPR